MTDNPKKDFNPKHRVVGAIVLVLVAVIVLPWVLSDGERDWHAEGGTDTLTENQVFVADLTATDTVEQTPPAESAPVSAPPATPVAPPVSAPAERAPTMVLAPKPAAPAPTVAAPAGKGFYVQVGTFGSEVNARHLADKLKRHGYRVHLERVRLASGDALRVRVGPYAQDAQAQAAHAAIKRKLGVQGMVRAY